MKPMLAHKYEDIKQTRFPYLAQRKYNGLRCYVEYNNYLVGDGLFSRTIATVKMFSKASNEYFVEHIWNAFFELYNANPSLVNIVFDGEFYVHEESINTIKSRIPMVLDGGERLSKPSLPAEPVTYVIYDIFVKTNPGLSQEKRIELLTTVYSKIIWNRSGCEAIRLADTVLVHTEEEAFKLRDKYIEEGYEGAMLRSLNAVYQEKRTNDLLKLKRISETECVILDIVDDGFKSDRENIAFILCNDINDETFKCTPGDKDVSWTNNYKRTIFENRNNYIGKKATITYRERSGVRKVPFHANVKTIKDYE